MSISAIVCFGSMVIKYSLGSDSAGKARLFFIGVIVFTHSRIAANYRILEIELQIKDTGK